MKKYKGYILWGLAVVIALIGGYLWGKHTSASAARGSFAGVAGLSSSTRSRFAGAGTGAASGGFTTGEITAIGSSSITLQLANGNSDVVFYSGSTSVTEPATVPVGTLKTGTNVMIMGTTNSDGSLTAQSIEVRPTGTGGGFGG